MEPAVGKDVKNKKSNLKRCVTKQRSVYSSAKRSTCCRYSRNQEPPRVLQAGEEKTKPVSSTRSPGKLLLSWEQRRRPRRQSHDAARLPEF